jgi:hypothetical protein
MMIDNHSYGNFEIKFKQQFQEKYLRNNKASGIRNIVSYINV